MYRCPKHGVKEKDWCEECKTLLKCSCEKIETQRYKNIFYGEKDWSLELRIYFCANCGKVFKLFDFE